MRAPTKWKIEMKTSVLGVSPTSFKDRPEDGEGQDHELRSGILPERLEALGEPCRLTKIPRQTAGMVPSTE